jgi:hypothetical protein
MSPNHDHAQNYDRHELEEINEALDFWKQLEHDGWVVTGFTGKLSCVFRKASWDANGSEVPGEMVQVSIDQVNFFRGAMKGKYLGAVDCLLA